MNRKQRDKNRDTERRLAASVPPTKMCVRCGELTYHGHYGGGVIGGEFVGGWSCKPAGADVDMAESIKRSNWA